MPTSSEYKSARAQVAGFATSFDTGTRTFICPLCNGGGSYEISLSVTSSPAGALFYCHRASCGFKGYVPPPGDGPRSEPPRPEFIPRYFVRPTRALDYTDTTRWSDILFRISGGVGVIFNRLAAQHRLQCEIQNPNHFLPVIKNIDHEELGRLSRLQYPGDRSRTIRTYRSMPGPFYGYYAPSEHNERLIRSPLIVLVEDVLSAVAVTRTGAHAIALLGTQIPMELAKELGQHHRNYRIVVALDPGAEDAASKVGATLRLTGHPDTVQIFLPADPKDMDVGPLFSTINSLALR